MDLKKLDLLIKTQNKTKLIFDFDETLFYLNIDWENWDKGIRMIAQKFSIDSEIIKDTIYCDELSNIIVENFGVVAKKELDNFSCDYEKNNLSNIKINKPLIEFLKERKQKLFLWSSNCFKTIQPILVEHDLYSRFDKIITRNDVDFIKPSTNGFDFIFENDGKENYLMVGNNPRTDGVAAKNAGIDYFNIEYF